jgi:hypothetical protein
MTMQMHFRKWPVVLGLSMFFLFDTFTGAQTTPLQSPPPSSNDNDRSDQDRDITRRELASFDKFLDSHREIAEQVRKNPSLVDNQQFLKDHPALQAYVQQHPEVSEELKENPNAFMSAENRYDRHELEPGRTRDPDDAHRHFGEFLSGHSNIAKDLSKEPAATPRCDLRDFTPWQCCHKIDEKGSKIVPLGGVPLLLESDSRSEMDVWCFSSFPVHSVQ